jgi:hypothetical protein
MTLGTQIPLTIIRGEQSEYPAAVADIAEGSMLGDSGAGYVSELVAGYPFRGHSMEDIENSGGSAGDQKVTCLTGQYRLEVTITGIAVTDVGKEVFASDRSTYTLTPGSNTKVGRVVRYVTTNTAIVLFDTLVTESGLSAMIVISPDGSDTEGDGSWLRPYASLTKAMALVSATRKIIFALPGTYAEAASVTWSTISGVQLIAIGGGQWKTEITAPIAADQLISVTPGAGTGTWEMWIDGIYLNHAQTGQDGLKLNNTGMTRKLNCYLNNVGSDAKSASDKTVTVTHGDTSNAVRIYWDGNNGGVEGAIYFQAKDGGDRFEATNVDFNGGLEFSTDAVAVGLKLIRCSFPHQGITGGSTTGVCHLIYCYTSDTFAVADASDTLSVSWATDAAIP